MKECQSQAHVKWECKYHVVILRFVFIVTFQELKGRCLVVVSGLVLEHGWFR